MDSSSLCISILLKSNIPENSLINFLNEVTSQSLRNYLFMMVMLIKRKVT